MLWYQAILSVCIFGCYPWMQLVNWFYVYFVLCMDEVYFFYLTKRANFLFDAVSRVWVLRYCSISLPETIRFVLFVHSSLRLCCFCTWVRMPPPRCTAYHLAARLHLYPNYFCVSEPLRNILWLVSAQWCSILF